MATDSDSAVGAPDSRFVGVGIYPLGVRGGGFVRVNFRAVEVTLSGGFAGNYLEDDPSGYASLGVYRTF